jgi:hypothetical protein
MSIDFAFRENSKFTLREINKFGASAEAFACAFSPCLLTQKTSTTVKSLQGGDFKVFVLHNSNIAR